MGCIAPSYVVSPPAAAAFGQIAESIIAGRYLAHVRRGAFFPASIKDFQDISIGFGNTSLMAAFLKANHSLSVSQLLHLSSFGLMKVPDLMTYDPPTRAEYYEVKPNSIDGNAAGRTKLANLAALFSSLGLPYRAGTIWNPNERVLLWSGYIAGGWIEAKLHFFSSSSTNGLIVYELCVEGELNRALENISLAMMIATIIVMVVMGPKIPVPA